MAFLRRLLFENRSLKQIVAKNTFWLVLSEVISRLLGLILVIYIARILGATEYGKFTFAFSFATMIAILSDLGLSDISTREFSRKKENEDKLGAILGLEVILCLFALIVAITSSFFITQDSNIRASIWILTLFVLANSIFNIIFAFLRAKQKMEYEAGIKIFQALTNLFIVLSVIFNIPSIKNLSYGYLVTNSVVLITVLLFFNYYFQKISVKIDKKVFYFLKISWPLSLGFMIGWIYMSINSIILGGLGLITENGWYNAASRIAIVAIMPAALIVRSFFPALSNFFISSKDSLQKAWNYFIEIMIILAVPIVIGGIFLSEKIISAFYGLEFLPSVLALQLLAVAIGISFLNYPYSVILVVADKQKVNFNLIFFGAILNIILDFIFIPFYGFYGVIVATIISCVSVFMLTVFFAKKLTSIIPFNKDLLFAFLISIFSGLVMLSIIKVDFIYNMKTIIVCLIGAISYCIVLFLSYVIIFPNKLLFLKKWRNI